MKETSSAALAGMLSARHMPLAAGPHQLLVVLSWELRRVLASRATWIMAGLTFAVFTALMLLAWGRDDPYHFQSFGLWASIVNPYQLLPGS